MQTVSRSLTPIACAAALGALVASAGPARSTTIVENPAARETIIYAFMGGSDGDAPVGTLIGDANGALYGTTQFGGLQACNNGCGTVFKLAPSTQGYRETILYRFRGGTDGKYPSGGLIADAKGALYGVTADGGNTGCRGYLCGVVFKLTPSRPFDGYTESVLYRFKGYPDGAQPGGPLVFDASGALYGTTAGGGASYFGTAYKLTKTASGYTEVLLRSFSGAPSGGLFIDGHGSLFGSANEGFGTIFELVRFGPGYVERVLYQFSGNESGLEPGTPVEDAGGNLWGMTQQGGGRGGGMAFKLTPTSSGYSERIIFRFRSESKNGEWPAGRLLAGTDGVFFGTTYSGDGFRTCIVECGVAFELYPSNGGYKERVLHRFTGSPDGGNPIGGLVRLASKRVLYGMTGTGGNNGCYGGCGTVFAIHL